MVEHEKQKNIINKSEELLKLLKTYGYNESSLHHYRKLYESLSNYMETKNITHYSVAVGKEFIEDYLVNRNIGISRQKIVRCIIGRLDDYCNGVIYTKQRRIPDLRFQLTENYQHILSDFIEDCKKASNKPTTIVGKRRYCCEFLKNLIELGCNDISDISIETVCKSFISFENKDAYAVVRQFLLHLYKNKIIDKDYASIIPRYNRAFKIPTTYTPEEVLRFEDAIDKKSKIGIRDYAMLLFATRLGMRSGDIANLRLSEVDFEKKCIQIIQSKTGKILQLPLLPEIQKSLIDYIENVRPSTDTCYIFLGVIAPFQKITTSVIRFAANKYFTLAGIDISNKKHGAHTFRATLATSMINDDIPYETVRRILGHSTPNMIKHYAKVDIEKLRDYAVEVPPASATFAALLEGRIWI